MVMANCHRDPKKRAFTINDFMPKLEKKAAKVKPKMSTPEQMINRLRMWNAAVGGKEVLNET
jgi:hypothetical protein